jgi:predicted branched-subunit amino acid permease
MEFLMPALYKTINIQTMWKEHQKANIILLAFIGLALGVFSFIAPPEWLVILLIVAISSGYKLLPPTKT